MGVRCVLLLHYCRSYAFVRQLDSVVNCHVDSCHMESWIPTHPFTNAVALSPFEAVNCRSEVKKFLKNPKVGQGSCPIAVLWHHTSALLPWSVSHDSVAPIVPPFVVRCASWHPLRSAISLLTLSIEKMGWAIQEPAMTGE